MAATQLVTGRGGWPMSVWLTPDRQPFYAGTYYPREDRVGWQPGHGQYRHPGFKTILSHFADFSRDEPAEVAEQVARLTQAVRQHVARDASASAPATDLVAVALHSLRATYDAERGGFSGRPKFPPHGSLRLLLWHHRQTLAAHAPDDQALAMAVTTLRAMALGGVHDHIGGGFHRYSTDERWLLPHFEKMLYDNAQLLRAYAEAHVATGAPDLRDVAERLVRWVLRDMRDPAGGLHSALDADSEGEEGTFYVWTPEQVIDALGPEDGARFCALYQVRPGGNWTEEATGERMRTSIPHLLEDPGPAASGALDAMRERLNAARSRRAWPALDDKVLTSWNALMLGALAHAGRLLDRPDWVEVASEVARFLLTTLRGPDGHLLASFRAGTARLNAYLDDHAFLADALLDLHVATGEPRWLAEAVALTQTMVDRFAAADGGGFYFTSSDHEALLVRSRNAIDNAIPSGNGVAARVLVRLHELTGEPRWLSLADRSLAAFTALASQYPLAAQSLVLAWAMRQRLGPTRPTPLARQAPVSVFVESSDSADSPDGAARTQAILRLVIDEGWHLQSARPSHPELVATTLAAVDAAAPAEDLRSLAWPAGERVEIGGELLDVYVGEVRVRVPLAATPRQLTLGYQPCDATSCQRPATLVFTVPAAGGLVTPE